MPALVGDVAPGGLGERLGLRVGDEIIGVNGVRPRDILEWQRLTAEDEVLIRVDRAGEILDRHAIREPGEPTGIAVESALFDRIHTCDNHCEFCFIHQLPKGMRRSLYLKDDDYRLSFLFGNFTTLTRFTEADLERVKDEGLSPLYVSVHSADPWSRAQMLRNSRGGTSLRWLDELLQAGIEVNGQIVLCPDVNDATALDETLLGVLERFDGLARVAVVPLGVSRFNSEERMRAMTVDEARSLVDQVDRWRDVFSAVLGRPLVTVGDEVYVAAGIEVPTADYYGDFAMVEDGVGCARRFVEEFARGVPLATVGPSAGFFASVDVPNPSPYVRINPASDTGLRHRTETEVSLRDRSRPSRVVVTTGECAADYVRAAVADFSRTSASDITIETMIVVNRFFGGNTSVAGLLTGADLSAAMASATAENAGASDTLFLIPDSCLNNGVFLDGTTFDDLRRRHRVEAVEARGHQLRRRLQSFVGSQR